MNDDYKELLIGCGNSREKRMLPYLLANLPYSSRFVKRNADWHSLTTLDMDKSCGPDIVWNLEQTPYEFANDNTYDEIHAYEVLEHCGTQGDFRFFFRQFGELWRILRRGGFLCATVPDFRSQWAFGDPGHTRVIPPCALVFLDQLEYARQVGKTAMSDYRWQLGNTDFKTVFARVQGETFTFVLQARK